MVYGMTAFARSERPTPAGTAIWEIRSVNHRFLETQFRLPEGYRDLEYALREAAKATLKRGKVDCTLRVERDEVAANLHIHRPTLLQLLAALEQIRRDMPEATPPTPLEMLRWPGVLSDDQDADPDAVKRDVSAGFDAALADLVAHRAREGAELKRVIEVRLTDIADIAAEVRTIAAGLGNQIRTRLAARIADLATDVDADRLEQEVALLAQRADIAEELDRLDLHLKEAAERLNGDGPHGRRLDFVTQELNREANTLGSKSILPETSRRAVDIKVIIEQIREQVQNLE